MEVSKFPPTPAYDQHQSFSSNGKPDCTMQIVPVNNQQSSLGANFSGLIGSNVSVPATVSPATMNTTTSSHKRKKRKKKSDSEDVEIVSSIGFDDDKVDSRNIVETTVYSDTYENTNNMAYGIINQTDQLLSECKQDLDTIRNQRAMKGKYHYINATMASMSQLLSTKLAAIKEINSTIKNVNDNEYRRFKDMRALDTQDDNKAIMDAYSAFISAPVGMPQYNLPGTTALTGCLNGITPVDYPANVQQSMDAGMANYLANLTPEENLMLNDGNKDIEEVIVYDQATGAKRFQWMNTRTNEMINNMPPSSTLSIDDYVVDVRTGLAKNNNLNSIKKVIIQNGSSFNNF